jgi:signal peptidase II
MVGEVISDWWVFDIHYIENPGMAFGWALGGDWGKIILSLFRVVAVVFIGFIIRNLIVNKAHRGLLIAVSLIFAGALGNILDSAFYGLMFSDSVGAVADFMPAEGGYAPFMMGYVVDMIHVEFYYPGWMPFGLSGNEVFPPVFNIADFAITAGVVVIILFNKRFFGKGKGDFSVFKKSHVGIENEKSFAVEPNIEGPAPETPEEPFVD